ncbi:glycosyltransferase family 4 protein [Xenorhabdus sp. ZM]|uniref:glycosyltransferase family 4 protein n=1 Tax=Xenorhabdus szentirmaii TaxID=290112 RepID=UPI0019AB6C6E|nr:glycosyltransferase family 4 protein [Xenorhabdus sp. ZM]MBD2804167.1 glycosyltransferase family 4 protein [Xenorhabdus sp. ZM]
MSKKRIFLCGNTTWSMYNFRSGLIKSLTQNGYSVCVLAPTDSFSDKLSDIGCEMIDIPLNGKGINPFNEFKLLLKLINTYKKEQPDLIINYTIKPNIYSTIAAKIAGVRSVAITTGLGFTFSNNSFISKITKILYKFSLHFSDKVWFLNADDRQVFLEQKIIGKEKSDILYGEGISMQHFMPIKKIKKDDYFNFILIARMLRDKGVIEFVETAKLIKHKYPQVKFQLLGFCDVENPSAISRAEIDLWVEQGLVEYLGITDDVRDFIASSDCVVLPSYYREGVPRILMEASAMEKPIITTDNVGCREVIVDKVTGYLCKVKNVNSLVEACEKILNTPDSKLSEMGIKGREFVAEKFSEEKIINKYLDFIKQSIG